METKPTFGFGNPVAIPRRFALSGPGVQRVYDVAKDGRFVALVAPGQDTGQSAAEIVVVLNGLDGLKQRVPR